MCETAKRGSHGVGQETEAAAVLSASASGTKRAAAHFALNLRHPIFRRAAAVKAFGLSKPYVSASAALPYWRRVAYTPRLCQFVPGFQRARTVPKMVWKESTRRVAP